MSLASRIARHQRQLRVIRQLREQRAVPSQRGDPGTLLDFIPRTSPRFSRPSHLAPLADAFEQGMRAPGSVRTCFSVPVRHGKTVTLQHAIAWILAKDPTASILYVSYAHQFAAKQTAKAREIALRAGVLMGQTRRRDEWTTKAGGLVKAAGIGGQITGEGFTHVIVDDPHKNRAEAESRTIREGVIEAFYNDVFTRRDPRGTNFYIVHARWHVNDLIGVLTRMDEHPFDRVNLPALAPANDNGEEEALAPWLFDVDELKELRDTLGPYVWASLYQGDPRPRGGTLFVEPTLSRIQRPRNYQIVIGLDLARSKSTRSDHNAAVVMRKDTDTGMMDILEAVRARGTVTDRVSGGEVVDEGFERLLIRLLHTYPEAQLCMYAMDLENPLLDLLSAHLTDALGYEIKIHSMPIAGDKYLRAQQYAASWNLGKVRIPGPSSLREAEDIDGERDDGRNRDGWQGPLISEHAGFTGVAGEEDDQVDAATAAHDFLQLKQGTSLEEAMSALGRIA